MTDRQRQELAQAAARLICEQGMLDYAQAKQRAAQQLSGRDRQALPSNSEIAEAVLEHLRLFEGELWQQRLAGLRRVGLEAMRLTAEFSPRATGALVNQLATVRSAAILHLFCPFDEALDFFLADRNIPFDAEEQRLRHPDGREIRRPSCIFMAGEVEVQLLVFAEEDARWSPLSPIDGRPMPRWTAEQLQASLEPVSS